MAVRPLVSILTLGCKLNLADSSEIAASLQAAGFDVTSGLCEADAYVVNTCSVTHVADQKSRKLIRAARRLRPGATVAVTGCFPRTAGQETVEGLGVDLVVGTRDGDKSNLVKYLEAHAGPASPAPAAPTALHTRAFIKAQEGCNDVCAFCIVPRTRGREESRDVVAVAREVASAVERGAREAVITGTQLGAWGRDLEPVLRPHHLIAGILARTDIARLRFSSLQPQDITPELLALWADPRLMPHFHLALQSGSDAVLQAMRRRYTATDFLDAVGRIRAAVPEAAITTDVIVGFPGETEEDFRATLALSGEARFARVHAFPYSVRSRTAAASLPDQHSPEVKRERMGRILDLAGTLARSFRGQFLNTTRPVLWDAERSQPDGQRVWAGYTDNYIEVVAVGESLANRITPTRLDRLDGDAVIGTVQARPGPLDHACSMVDGEAQHGRR